MLGRGGRWLRWFVAYKTGSCQLVSGSCWLVACTGVSCWPMSGTALVVLARGHYRSLAGLWQELLGRFSSWRTLLGCVGSLRARLGPNGLFWTLLSRAGFWFALLGSCWFVAVTAGVVLAPGGRCSVVMVGGQCWGRAGS